MTLLAINPYRTAAATARKHLSSSLSLSSLAASARGPRLLLSLQHMVGAGIRTWFKGEDDN